MEDFCHSLGEVIKAGVVGRWGVRKEEGEKMTGDSGAMAEEAFITVLLQKNTPSGSSGHYPPPLQAPLVLGSFRKNQHHYISQIH